MSTVAELPERPASRPDPTVRFTLAMIVTAAPVIALVALTGSHLLGIVLGGVFALWLVVGFPGVTANRMMAVSLALAPDVVTVAHIGGSPVTLRSTVFLLLAMGTLLALVRGRLRLRVPTPFLLAAFVAAGVLGALDSGRTKSLLEFALLLVVPPVVGATLASDLDVAREFLRGLCAGTVVLCVMALVETLTNHSLLVNSTALATLERAGHVRANAGWSYPTELSAFLCLGAFFVVEVFQRRWRLVGMGIGGVLVTAAVIATQSRSGLLGLVAGGATYLLLQRRLSQALRVVVGLAATVGLLLVLPGAAPASFRSFLGQSLTPGSSANANIHYRQQLYDAAGAAMAHHPWFGYGYGSGKSVAVNELSTYFGSLTDLASLPVSLAVQVGYVGAVAVALMLLVSVVRISRSSGAMGRVPMVSGIVACVVAMLGVPVSPPLSWMMLLAGMAATIPRVLRDTQAGEQAPDPDPEPPLPFAVGAWSGVRRVR